MTDDLYDGIDMNNDDRDYKTEAEIAAARCDHLERKLAEKEYELDLTGAMARLNVAGQVLGGMYSNDEYNATDVGAMCDHAMDTADTLVSAYEKKMEERAAAFMSTRALGPNDPILNPTTEN